MTAIYVAFHSWRGLSVANAERDLFAYVFKLGFVTVYVCKQCLLNAYRKLRRTIEERVAKEQQRLDLGDD